MTGSGSTFTLEDSVSNIWAGAGCTQLASKKVRCSSVPNGPIASVYLDLRDQDDAVLDAASIDIEVSAGDGNDKLTGGADRDKLYGGAGDDLLDGGLGADLLVGEGGIDRVTYASRTLPLDVTVGNFYGDGQYGEWDYVSSTVEEVVGGSADDKLTGNSTANTLIGGPGNDSLTGSDGNDVLEGGDGTDKLDAGNGDDTLRSRDAAADTVNCGAGTDLADVDSTDTVAPDCELPAAAPAAPAGAILDAVPSTVRLTRKGYVRIQVTCPITAVYGCTGSISVAVLPAAKTSAMAYRAAASKREEFSLKAGQTKVTKVKISRNGRRRVLAKKRAKCKVSVHTTNSGTKRVTVSKKITVKAPKKVKKHRRSR